MSAYSLSPHAAPKRLTSTRRSTPIRPQQKVSSKPSPRWKLTRRGKLLFRGLPLITLAALIVLGAIALINPSEAHAGKEGASSVVTQEIAVQGGQTLWDIALEVETSADTRDVVQQIIEINDLKGSSIDAGQRLEIPLYAEK